MIKLIEDNNVLYAKIIRSSYIPKDCDFFTREKDEIQLGIVNYKKDYKTGAHYHNHLREKTNQTDEILIIQQGSARVDFFNEKGAYIKSSEVFQGDIVIIYKGGHNLLYYEDTRLYMIKSGPYEKDADTTRIIGANNLELKIEND